MGTQNVPRRTKRCKITSFPPGLASKAAKALRIIRRWDKIVLQRTMELGRSDPSWHGPGPYGLRHVFAAGNPTAVPGVRLY